MIVKETILLSSSTKPTMNNPSSFFYTGQLCEVRYRPFTTKHWPSTGAYLRFYRTTSTGTRHNRELFAMSVLGASEHSFYPSMRLTSSSTGATPSGHSTEGRSPVVFVDQKFMVSKTSGVLQKTTAVKCFIDIYFDGVQSRSSERGYQIRETLNL